MVKRRNQALFDPISLTLNTGSYLEVTGTNGSGKTTLLRTLAGLYDQFDGTYQCAPSLYCGHRLGLDPLLSPLENLQWLLHLSDQSSLASSIDLLVNALNKVGLAPRGMDPVSTLSQGQQRRVAMAWWSLSKSSVWLLDEPLNALDNDGRALVNSLISGQLANNGIVICASHLPLQIDGSTSHLRLQAPRTAT